MASFARGGKATILESFTLLVLMGAIAGALGGLAIGVVGKGHSSTAAPANAQPNPK